MARIHNFIFSDVGVCIETLKSQQPSTNSWLENINNAHVHIN